LSGHQFDNSRANAISQAVPARNAFVSCFVGKPTGWCDCTAKK